MSNTQPPPIIVPAAWLEDRRLRHAELGVLIRLASTISDRTPVARLADESADGGDAVATALRRLARYGYVEHVQAPEAIRGRGWRLTEAARQGQVSA